MNISLRRFLVVLPAVVAFCGARFSPVQAAPAKTLRFPTQNGVVKYRMTSSDNAKVNSNVTLIWMNSGSRFRQDSQTRISGSTRPMSVNSWILYDGKALYVSTSSSMGAKTTGSKIAYRTALDAKTYERILPGSAQNKGRLVGRGQIVGKPCEIRIADIKANGYSVRAKMWMWQNLPLRSEITTNMKVQGMARKMNLTIVATQLNTNVNPSPSLFRVPAGYKVKNMADLQRQTRALSAGKTARR